MSSNRNNDIDNSNNDINGDDSSSGSSVYVRIIPGNNPTDSETEGSVDSQVSRPKCTIKVKVKFGSKQSVTEFTTIKVTQDDFHECRVYTMDPVKPRRTEKKTGPVTKVWSSAAGPVTFELEVREKKQPPQLFGPLTEAKTKDWKDHKQYLKRKRGDPQSRSILALNWTCTRKFAKQAHTLTLRPIKFVNRKRPTVAAEASIRKLPVTLKRPHLNRLTSSSG